MIAKAAYYPFFVYELHGVVDVSWTACEKRAMDIPDDWEAGKAVEILSQIGGIDVELVERTTNLRQPQ